MPTDIERELLASYRIVLELAEKDEAGQRTIEEARKMLECPVKNVLAQIDATEDGFPHEDIEWDTPRQEGKGGRRSTQEYKDLAWSYGFIFPDKIGWMPARDAARALEYADSRMNEQHINIHTEGQWLRDLS